MGSVGRSRSEAPCSNQFRDLDTATPSVERFSAVLRAFCGLTETCLILLAVAKGET